MKRYNDFHSNDTLLSDNFDINNYCDNRTSDEEAIMPFLSFPILKACNFFCVYCGEAGEATASKQDKISLEMIKELVSIVKKLGVKKFRITGGEPFLHKDIGRILYYFNNVGCYTLINTNGSLITDNKEIVCKLNPDLFKFAISLDTLNKERFVDISRPRNPIYTLDKTLAGVEYLLEHDLLLRINMVVGMHNYDEVFDMINFCKERKCRLKLLDIVSVPKPNENRQNYFVDLTNLEQELREKCDNVFSHSYTKMFGVPCFQYKFGETFVTVKNGTKGSHYDLEGVCENCKFYPCHEGVYDIFAYSDGRICSCRWRDDQKYENTEKQLSYMIESFRRAQFLYGVNSLHEDMPNRQDI